MLSIFNPEHDLCLANGNAHYVPPQSALNFAMRDADLMLRIYPHADCLPSPLADAEVVRRYIRQHGHEELSIVAWGWNSALKKALLKAGMDECGLPSDDALDTLRTLQHRSTVLPLQPDCMAATTATEIEEMIQRHHAVVLKAPWSGSGRGLRWVTGGMSQHDCFWTEKIISTQRCVIVEPRREVDLDYAIEYWIAGGTLHFIGYSIFENDNGVYRQNIILPEDELAQRIRLPELLREQIEGWLLRHIAPHYSGPVGIDMIRDNLGHHHLCELNLRHTMGMIFSTGGAICETLFVSLHP